MTFSMDTNILLYATFSQYPEHKQCRAFLDKMLSSQNSCVLTWDVVHSYIRIATHPSIYETPLSSSDAIANIQNLMEHPNVSLLGSTRESWGLFAEIVTHQNLRGNDVPDAVIASVLLGNGVFRLYTNDKGFRRFDKLEAVSVIK